MTPDQIAALPYRPNVGIMLIDGRGLIFAAQRLDNPVPAWQMPQGGIDNGEDPRRAALRELEEEIGVPPALVQVLAETDDWLTYDLPPDLLGKVWKGKFRGQRQKWFLMRFLGRDEQIDLAQEHPEFSEWRWIDAQTMIDAIVPFKRDIYTQVVAAFRTHLA
ncbi:MAG: RNA pyrophosphohydrolase [Rhodobacter sp.]|uniref:RNA pyrophosphohydrolase n=1 Tax=Pararhodobacter sp. TaxID=2127056 RepID=UPI002B7DC62F|nr:RNA pyrophosphohydrolase [Pararhodobacter sp.]MCC0072119.1 RNA pyrophosphohydrolase [Rhodobacter sp.]HPD91610.1 RNA pyrophosphohydrolase [Pararhodobacter sp.]